MFFCLSIVESHKRCKFHRFFKCHLLSLKCTVNSNFLCYWYQTFIYLFFLHFLIPEVRCFRFLCSYNYVFFFFSLFFLSFFFCLDTFLILFAFLFFPLVNQSTENIPCCQPGRRGVIMDLQVSFYYYIQSLCY